ncbi:unnamed protein product [Bursaphelenchus okinawaensis]|uniref:Uncharacterized protein n=1 Tax=Bursaphelenchus okinawaensis TaxID=465554 RepID=A0A811JQP3_9BILA|nr:unnamed protein product [Bursaphelenchus okinawaensis]CAG9078186.1 unnamed protein product [Bursaphelenchus okinawaensis]
MLLARYASAYRGTIGTVGEYQGKPEDSKGAEESSSQELVQNEDKPEVGVERKLEPGTETRQEWSQKPKSKNVKYQKASQDKRCLKFGP